jgi:hypothetical protein
MTGLGGAPAPAYPVLFGAKTSVGWAHFRPATALVDLRVATFRRAAFDRAAAEVGACGLRPHDLRHTAASLAIQSRATIKVVQKMLGHASATVTLDRYGQLYADDLDDLADRMHAAAEASRGNSADFLRTSGELILLPERPELDRAP